MTAKRKPAIIPWLTELQGAHPRASNETRDEIELYLRDAFAAGCQAAQERSLFVAMKYAKREAPKLRALLKQPALPPTFRRLGRAAEVWLSYHGPQQVAGAYPGCSAFAKVATRPCRMEGQATEGTEMSDTPRTDDQRIIARNLKWNIECVWEWAQQLERELAALREMARDFEDPDAQTAICDAADSLRKSADALKARVEQETQSAFLLRDEQNRRVAAQDELAEARRDTDFWRTAWSEKWDAQRVGAGQSAAAMQEGKT